MLEAAVIAFENPRAKMNSAIRPYRYFCAFTMDFLTLPICMNPHTLKPALVVSIITLNWLTGRVPSCASAPRTAILASYVHTG